MNNETLIINNKQKTAAIFEIENSEGIIQSYELYCGFAEREKVATYSTKEEALKNFEKDSEEFLSFKIDI